MFVPNQPTAIEPSLHTLSHHQPHSPMSPCSGWDSGESKNSKIKLGFSGHSEHVLMEIQHFI